MRLRALRNHALPRVVSQPVPDQILENLRVLGHAGAAAKEKHLVDKQHGRGLDAESDIVRIRRGDTHPHRPPNIKPPHLEKRKKKEEGEGKGGGIREDKRGEEKHG